MFYRFPVPENLQFALDYLSWPYPLLDGVASMKELVNLNRFYRIFAVGALSLALLPWLAGCGSREPSHSDLKIVGGQLIGKDKSTTEDDFPSTIALGWCTGTKIGPRLILTAAHCAYSSGAGISFNARAGNGQEFRVTVKEAYKHPDYDRSRNTEFETSPDIAVLETTRDIPNVPIASISFDPVEVGDHIILNGAGSNEDTRFTPEDWDRYENIGTVLRYGPQIVSNIHPVTFTSPKLNQYGKHLRVAPGDSGGPVYKRKPDGSLRVVGVNIGRRGSTPDDYSFHVRLDRYAGPAGRPIQNWLYNILIDESHKVLSWTLADVETIERELSNRLTRGFRNCKVTYGFSEVLDNTDFRSYFTFKVTSDDHLRAMSIRSTFGRFRSAEERYLNLDLDSKFPGCDLR